MEAFKNLQPKTIVSNPPSFGQRKVTGMLQLLAKVEARSSDGLFAINKANATNLGLPVSVLGFERGRGHSKESAQSIISHGTF